MIKIIYFLHIRITIDAIFIRYVDNVKSNFFVAYFIYQWPIIIIIPDVTDETWYLILNI